MAATPDDAMLYERLGGDAGGLAFLSTLVDAFYEGVATDEVLAPLYPERPDFGTARERLTLFLVQYWGGPQTYMEQRGHPRLRMRHLPFRVGEIERDRWLVHMAAAIEAVCDGRPDGVAVARELLDYFVPAAEHLRNDQPLGLRP